MNRTAGVSLVLLLVSLGVYWQTVHHEFTNFDDGEYVSENRFIQKGLTTESIIWAFKTGHASNWHPVTWLSHMLDCQLFGLNPGYHHLTNVFFHCTNAILLFLILSYMTGAFWKSAFVAALFALHPLHVESVAWIAERKDVLSTFFWLLTVGAYGYYARKPGTKRYLAVLVLFSFGLMAKPMVVTLPFVLLLLDYWPLGRISFGDVKGNSVRKSRHPETPIQLKTRAISLVREKIPLFILSAMGSVVTFFIQNSRGVVRNLEIVSLGSRISNAIVSYGCYIMKTIWPLKLAVFYPHPGGNLPVWKVLGASVFLLTVTLLVVRYARRFPFLVTGWLWYLGILVPVIGFVQVGNQAMADRYTYIPIVGIFIIAAWGVPELMRKFRFPGIIIPVMAGVILLASAERAWVQTGYWHDCDMLYRHALEVTDGNYLAHNNLGAYLIEKKNYEEAIGHFTEALRFKPEYIDARINLGVLLHNEGNQDEALKQYTEVLRIDPDNAKAHNNLGAVMEDIGKKEEAIGQYTEALRLEPDYAKAHTNLGKVLLGSGNNDEAYVHFAEALRLEPMNAEVQNNMGVMLDALGKHENAITCYNEALRMNPDYVEAHSNLGNECLRLGMLEEAVSHYNEALRLKPGYAEAHCKLGSVYLRTGDLDRAFTHCTEALRLKPEYPDAQYNLGTVYARKGNPTEAAKHYYEALRQKPDYAEVHTNLGNVFFSCGILDSARVHYDRALELKPDYAEALNNLGSVLFRQGKIKAAINHYNKAVTIKPDYAEARSNLAHALEFQKADNEN
ncbi:tetratricopeptide repeat protein [bacterium]|nr:tetratricopeptide repeat protein [bacterium]